MSVASPLSTTPQPYDVARVRADFPVLATTVRGKRLAFLDTAASAQRPSQVIEAVARYERTSHANVHRGVYQLSQKATDAFEGARVRVQRFLNAASEREVIFTRGTTESINLVAQSWARNRLGPGDEILITWMEHHANIVPWQMVCEQTGATLKVAPIDAQGELRLSAFRELLTPRTRLVAFTAVSNALGTVLPAAEIIAAARAVGATVLVDAAQAVPHQKVDVRALDCDFLAFSGHKLYGPTGVGVLHGKAEHLEVMPPYQGGGDMIERVSFAGTTWNEIPFKFEAGTPDIAGIVAFGAAIDYVEALGLDDIALHEAEVLAYATRALNQIPGLRLIGTAPEKCSVLTFALEGVHPQDLAALLDLDGIAIRTGHHCAMPLHERFGLAASARASIGLYTSFQDIDTFVASLRRAGGMLQ